MANRYMKRRSPSLIVMGMQIKTSVKYDPHPVRTAVMEKTRDSEYWRGCGEKGTFVCSWWKCQLVQTLWETVRRFLKKKKEKEKETETIT